MGSKFASFFSVENIVIVEMLVGKELPLVLMFDMSKQYQRVFLKLDHNVSQLMAIGVSKWVEISGVLKATPRILRYVIGFLRPLLILGLLLLTTGF